MEVEHVKAHRTKKEKKDMSHFEKFITGGNEKADPPATEGALLDNGFMAEARAKTISLAACGQLPLLSKRMEGL